MGKTVTDRSAPAASRGVARNVAPPAMRSRTREQLLASTAVRLALQASVLAGLACAATVPASANPTGGTVVQGSAAINQSNPNNTVITQTTDRAAINWQSFSIGANQTTQFIQPSTSSTALNRVLGNDPSVIAGHLTANGNLVLINPNGVVFSAGSQVNVNSIIATPADIKDADFMAGKMNFSTPAPANSSVVNEGTITVNQLGIAALVGPKVANSGVINAKLGHVVLGGAETFTVDLYGDGLLSFDVGSKAHSPLSVVNSGQINAEGGTVQISAETADALVTSVVNLGGQINAPTGTVTADAGPTGQLTVSGTVDVSGKAAGQLGGAATLTGQDVAIESGALIDASGSAGGGSIKVGGGLHGADATVRNAAATNVAAGATLDASAIDKGNGGTIAVWSDQQTNFAGNVKATGGAKGGDGGFAEVSSKGVLGFTGMVNLTAPFGKLGTLLLDPAELDIVGAGGDTVTCTAGTCIATTSSVLTNTTLDGLLNGATVNLFADTIDFKANVAGSGSLVANATTSIVIDPGVSISNGAAGSSLNVSLLSGPPESTTVVGNITFGANTSIVTGGGQLAILATGQLALDPTTLLRTAGGFTSLGAQSLTLPNTIDAGDNGLQLNATAGGIRQTGGSITAGFIRGSSQGDVVLGQAANNIGQIAGFTTGNGAFSLNTASDLVIGDTIDAGVSPILITTAGHLQLGIDGIAATFNSTGGATLGASGGIDMQGNATTNGATTVIAGGTGFNDNGFIFSTTGNLLNVTTPALTLAAGGGLNSGAAATTISAPTGQGMSVGTAVAGTLNVTNADLSQITAGSLTLTTATGQDITVNGATSVAGNGAITLQSGGKLSFPGDFAAPGGLQTIAAGTIAETGGGITAPFLLGSAGGDVDLNGANNQIGIVSSFTVNGGHFSLVDAGRSLTIGSPVGTPTLDVSGNIDITEAGGPLLLGRVGSTGSFALAVVVPTGPALDADLRSGGTITLSATDPAAGSVGIATALTTNAPTVFNVAGPLFVAATGATINTGTNPLAIAAINRGMSIGTAEEGTLNISDGLLGQITSGSLTLATSGGNDVNIDSVTAHAALGPVTVNSSGDVLIQAVPGVAAGTVAFANNFTANTARSPVAELNIGEDLSTTGAQTQITLNSGSTIRQDAGTITTGTLNLIADDGITQDGGSIVVGTLTAQGGGNIDLFGTTNSIDNIGALSSTGGFIDLQANAPGHLLTIAGPVTNTAANGEVFLQAGGDMTVDGQVTSQANHVVLNSGGALTLTGNAAVAAPASFVDLTSVGSMQINGSVQAPIGNVDLFSQGGITEGATGAIITPLLSADATAGSLLLNSPGNQVGVLGGVFVNGGNFSFVNGTNLIVADIPGDGAPQNAINAGTGSINVQVQGGTLTLGRPTQPAGSIEPETATLLGTGGITLGASGDINVAGATTANAATNMTAGGNIGLAANLGITGDLSLVATTGAVDQTSGRLTISGALTGSSATDTTLTTVGDVAPNNIPTLGTFTAGGTLTLNDGVPLTVAGNVSAGTQITLSATFAEALGGITQNSGTITAPTLSLNTSGDVLQNSGNLAIGTLLAQAGGGITLFNGTNSTNSINTIGAVSAGGGIAIQANTPLTVAGPVIGNDGEVFLGTSGGAMTVNGQVSSLAAGNTIGGVLLSASAGPLTITGNALVSSADRGVGLQSGGPMEIDGEVLAPRGGIGLSGSGVNQADTGSLVAQTLTMDEVGNVTLTSGDNQVNTLTNIHVRLGNFTFVNDGNLTIVDIVNQGTLTPAIDADTGKVNVQAAGTITLGAPLQDTEVPPPTTATIIGTGGVTLAATDGDVNVVGPTTISGATALAGGNIGLGDNLGVTGDLQLAAPGAITQTGGLLTVTGALSGSSGADTTLIANVATLGSFAAQGALSLANTAPLTVAGKVTAGGDISLSAQGTMTVNGGSFATPGNITFQVSAVEGPAQFTQTGTTTFDPQTITINVAPPAFLSGSTLLPAPLVSLDNFIAPQANLVLQLGNGRATANNLQVGGLDVIGQGGSAALAGSIGGVTGPAAARLAFQSSTPPDPLYQLNNCTIQLGCTPPSSIFNPNDPVIDILAALQASVSHDGVVYLSTGRQKKPYTDPTIDTLNIGSEDLF